MLQERLQPFVSRPKMFLCVLVYILVSCTSCIFGTGYGSYVNENIKPKNIEGIVVGKYKENIGCFGAIIVKQNNTLDTLREVFYCTVKEEKVWSYIIINDSIYKEAGSLSVDVVRNGVKTKFVFPTRD